jgi:RNA polymerase sigma-70 factor (ECF subfamily)
MVTRSFAKVISEQPRTATTTARNATSFIDQTFMADVLKHRRVLTAFANMLTRNSTAADDLVQDTIEKALRAARQFKSGTNLRAWLTRIMRNAFTDSCRSGARLVTIDRTDFWETALADLQAEQVQPTAVGFIDLVTMADVHLALKAIEPASRQIFTMAHIDGVSYGAIAVQLRIPVSTVGTRLLRARRKVRHVMERTWAQSVPRAA